MKANIENTLIVIPVYNNARYITKLYQKINNIYQNAHLLFINDGSTDRSLEIMQILALNVLDLKKNKGKGFALKTGFEYAKTNKFQYVITMDSDLQHDPNYLPNFFITQNVENADLVIGFRDFSFQNMPFARVFSNAITSSIVSYKTGVEIMDSQSGYRLYNLDYYDKRNIITDKYQMETEILLSYIKQKALIAHTEIPVIYGEENSNISHLRDILNFIKIIIGK